MKTVNRGYMLVEPKQAFCDWAKQNDPDFDFDETDDLEGSLYLIEEDFFEYEPLVEAHFKKIFKNECLAVVDDENLFPKPTIDLFNEWFAIRIGGSVFDTQKTDLVAEK
jgi:hypothetical protein